MTIWQRPCGPEPRNRSRTMRRIFCPLPTFTLPPRPFILPPRAKTAYLNGLVVWRWVVLVWNGSIVLLNRCRAHTRSRSMRCGALRSGSWRCDLINRPRVAEKVVARCMRAPWVHPASPEICGICRVKSSGLPCGRSGRTAYESSTMSNY